MAASFLLLSHSLFLSPFLCLARLAADRDVRFAVANTDTAAGCRLQVARCCLRCPNGIFGQRGGEWGTCRFCCCCCCWRCYLTLDFLSLMKCGYKCNFTFFKKHFICRRQARERRHNSQPRPAARDMQPCVCCHGSCVCVCVPCSYHGTSSEPGWVRQLVCTLSKLVFVPK